MSILEITLSKLYNEKNKDFPYVTPAVVLPGKPGFEGYHTSQACGIFYTGADYAIMVVEVLFLSVLRYRKGQSMD